MKYSFSLFILFFSLKTYSQVGIGTVNPHSSAILEVHSNNKGFIPPVMNSTQMFEIVNPAEGLLLFNTDEACVCYFNGTNWINLCSNQILIKASNFDSSIIRLKANNVGASDYFGYSVSISNDGNTIAVGARTEDSDGTGSDNDNVGNSGAAYVYRYSGGNWSNGIRLKANNVGVNDYFGHSLSISGDGNIIIVGAYGEDSDGTGSDNDNAVNSGAAYVYRYVGGSWGAGIRLKANNVGSGDLFGYTVSISGDGNTVVVGARNEGSDGTGNDNDNALMSGAAYVYRYVGGNWDTGIRLKANNVGSSDRFGYSVSISDDGNTVVVGAIYEGSDGTGSDNDNAASSGAAYVFRYTGAAWDLGTRLKANNVGIGDIFGQSVSISDDGNTLVVGASREDSDGTGSDNDNVGNSGAVYVYRYTGGTWDTGVRLKANNVGSSDRFGYSVSISNDGNTLIVGGVLEDSDDTGNDNDNFSNSGAAYVYRYAGGNWSTGIRLKANNVGSNDYFGHYISISGDGNTLVVGARSEDSDGTGTDNDNAGNSGAAYIIK
jgi:hypothetical protein